MASRRQRHSRSKGAGSKPIKSGWYQVDVALGAIVVLIALAGTALFLIKERRIAGNWGFSLDDSWIHANIARNIATGHGYSFNAGETTGGSTAPLYTFMLAALFAVAGPSVLAAKWIGMIAHAGASLLLYKALTSIAHRPVAFASALAMAASPSLLWASVSGMEISTYVLLLVSGIFFHIRGRPLVGTALWSLGIWVRPDGILLPALSLVLLSENAARRVGIVLAFAVPYFLFNMLVGHSLFPASVAAKSHLADAGQVASFFGSQGDLWGIPTRAAEGVLHSPLLLASAIIGGIAGGKLPRFLLLYIFAFAIGFGLVASNAGPQHRYMIPLIPIVITLACLGAQIGLPRVRSRSIQTILAVLLLAPGVMAVPSMATAHAWNVQNINGMQRFMGELVAKESAPSDKIATNDIGAIGFFGRRYVVDTVGLISPRRTLPELLTSYRPRFLIIYPNWYRAYGRVDPASSDLYFDDADSTYRYWGQFGVELRHNTVSARNKLLVFVRTPRGAPAPRNLWMYHH